MGGDRKVRPRLTVVNAEPALPAKDGGNRALMEPNPMTQPPCAMDRIGVLMTANPDDPLEAWPRC